ncbi:MAG: RibD family protein [Sulfolobales archaeon]|nr:RibD family protein [Sulfolobales archaeon]
MPKGVNVISYTTLSLDGRIGNLGKRTTLSKDCDLRRLHALRASVDAIIVGANTVLSDNPLLTARLPNYSGKQPIRVVVDSRLRTSPLYRVYDTSIAPSMLITSINSDRFMKDEFMKRGVEVVEIMGEEFSAEEIVNAVKERHPEVKKILIEGGGILLSTFINDGFIDELIVALAPIMLGESCVSIFPKNITEPLKLRLVNVNICICGQEVVLKYRVPPSVMGS